MIMASPPSPEYEPQTPESEPAWFAIVREKVASLRYGVVQVVVHNGRVIQIERTEKTRLQSGREGQPAE
jgi:hypothetical protein